MFSFDWQCSFTIVVSDIATPASGEDLACVLTQTSGGFKKGINITIIHLIN